MSALVIPNGTKSWADVWWEFGPREPIWTPAGWTSNFHAGIDLGPGGGRELYAAVPGTITLSKFDSVFGNWVILTEAGTGDEFWYCHLASRSVLAGATVAAGQYIGYMGETGKASGVHLHFEVHPHGGAAVDPVIYYRNRRNAPAFAGGTTKEDTMSLRIARNKDDSADQGSRFIWGDGKAPEVISKSTADIFKDAGVPESPMSRDRWLWLLEWVKERSRTQP